MVNPNEFLILNKDSKGVIYVLINGILIQHPLPKNIDVAGKSACVIGRSSILGKPAALMLLNKDANVTMCHSKTKNLKDIVKSSDIVVAALGEPEFIKKSG